MALILVVDDSADNLILMEEFLHNLGHCCRVARSGRLAMEVLSTESFDLIISDLNMADGDGIWLLEQLNGLAGAAKCIVVTNDLRFDSNYFKMKGALAYFSRPIHWDELQEEILKLASSKRASH